MKTDKEIKNYKEQLQRLRDAYTELLTVFHNVKHFTVEKQVHESLFPINRAIVDLEELLKYETR